jgi:phage terminase large subunit-like protein
MLLKECLAVDADQKFVHRSSLVSVARQNGKTTIIQALILFWLVEMPKIGVANRPWYLARTDLDLACLLFDDLHQFLRSITAPRS